MFLSKCDVSNPMSISFLSNYKISNNSVLDDLLKY